MFVVILELAHAVGLGLYVRLYRALVTTPMAFPQNRGADFIHLAVLLQLCLSNIVFMGLQILLVKLLQNWLLALGGFIMRGLRRINDFSGSGQIN